MKNVSLQKIGCKWEVDYNDNRGSKRDSAYGYNRFATKREALLAINEKYKSKKFNLNLIE